MLKRKKEFVTALAVVVTVLMLLALPYAVTETYGLKAKKWILLMHLVVSAGLLFWLLVRYRQTSHDIETLRDEIKRTRLFRMRQFEIWRKSRERRFCTQKERDKRK